MSEPVNGAYPSASRVHEACGAGRRLILTFPVDIQALNHVRYNELITRFGFDTPNFAIVNKRESISNHFF